MAILLNLVKSIQESYSLRMHGILHHNIHTCEVIFEHTYTTPSLFDLVLFRQRTVVCLDILLALILAPSLFHFLS